MSDLVKQERGSNNHQAYINDYLNFEIASDFSLNVNQKIDKLVNFANEFYKFNSEKQNNGKVCDAKAHMTRAFIKKMSNESESGIKSKGLERAIDLVERDYIQELKITHDKLIPLTRDVICQLHEELLFFDDERRGKFRHLPDHKAFVKCPITRKRHEYPSPVTVRERLEHLCDVSLCLQEAILNQQKEYGITSDVVKLHLRFAAWAFYTLISLHPFRNGNGRLSRLVFGYLLSNLCPFWCPICDDLTTTRMQYLEAIVEAREAVDVNGSWSLKPRPEMLTALALDSMLAAWHTFHGHLTGSKLHMNNENIHFDFSSSQESLDANSSASKQIDSNKHQLQLNEAKIRNGSEEPTTTVLPVGETLETSDNVHCFMYKFSSLSVKYKE